MLVASDMKVQRSGVSKARFSEYLQWVLVVFLLVMLGFSRTLAKLALNRSLFHVIIVYGFEKALDGLCSDAVDVFHLGHVDLREVGR